MTAFYGDGQRSEWRYKLTPEQLKVLEARERPRLEKARAARAARREANRLAWRRRAEIAEGDRAMSGYLQEGEAYLKFLDRFCGAKTRKNGEPCRSVAIRPNGRCKWHGGLSTGPRTAEGYERAQEARRAGLAAWRAAGSPRRPYKMSPQGRARVAAANRKRALRQKAV